MPQPRGDQGARPLGRRAVAGGLGLALALVALQATAGSAADDPAADPADPALDGTTAGARYPAVVDPGAGADDYFSPLWPDDGGAHVQAHGGQVVETEEDGRTVYYWYGEDRSNGYYGSPGVHAYKSYDTKSWTDEGVVLRSVSDPSELESAYFDDLYDTVDDAGQPRAERIEELDYHLDTNDAADLTTIFERPKVMHNEKTGKWVLWWHSDGQTTPGGSMYARSMAGVAVADSPTGPFRMTGVYRMPNRTNYQDCISAAVPGQARDMTVFQDADGTAYLVYSSEENRSLYVAELDATYTNVTHTTGTDMADAGQYSEDGRYPYLFADGTPEAPVRGEDFQIVKECGMLEAPALFEHGGTYYAVASGATGWAPNPQTYYTAPSLLGPWIRGVEADDEYEDVPYGSIPEGGDGLLAVGDTRRSTFGSQSTNVLDLGGGRFVYMGDRWNAGAADSTYVWLPITIGENGRAELRNPATEDPARWGAGWDESYGDSRGAGDGIWSVVDDGLPERVGPREDFSGALPTAVPVEVDGETTDVAVTWDASSFDTRGEHTITGTLAADDRFAAGRTFSRTIEVAEEGVVELCGADGTTVSASFHQTDWETMPAAQACDGKASTSWSTWASSAMKDEVTFTVEPSEARVVDQVAFTNIEGTIARFGVEYRDADGTWHATTAQDVAPGANGTRTAVAFEPVWAAAVRLTFATPGSYLKIPELTVDAPPTTVEPAVSVRCVGTGRAQLVTTVRNATDRAGDVDVRTERGSRTVRELAPGGSGSAVVSTREAALAAGSATVTLGGGDAVAVGYAGRDCD
ncbi:glycoside hydrolase family 43 protein [Krasilnikoviella flava]|uniref:F5/8 type C domain-containing protein n=1 Tax=Krasilnikoviella flava TaxID=526729 RepID=A0A1T5KAL4_9MICO|nr:glycoside hydrolase family 43 protein [Krasilnikoviella flava]SKC60711.1 F5/8 type C domain-containing protein [Krasilnikoviella flava]